MSNSGLIFDSYTLKSSEIFVVSDDVSVYQSGNSLHFLNFRNNENRILSFPPAVTLDCFAVDPFHGVIVCATHSVNAQLQLFKYPNIGQPDYVIDAPEEILLYSDVAISGDCERIATTNALSEFTLTLWQLHDFLNKEQSTSHSLLCTEIIPEKWMEISFNPISHLQLMTRHRNKIIFWASPSEHENRLVNRVVRFQKEFQTQDRKLTCAKWSHNGRVYCGTLGGEVFTCVADSSEPMIHLHTIIPSEGNDHGPMGCAAWDIVTSKRHLIVACGDGNMYWFTVAYKKKGKLVLTPVLKDDMKDDREGNSALIRLEFNPSFKSILVSDKDGGVFVVDIIGDVSELRLEEHHMNPEIFSVLPVSRFHSIEAGFMAGISPIKIEKQRSIVCTYSNDRIVFWEVTEYSRRHIRTFVIPSAVLRAKGVTSSVSYLTVSHNSRLIACGLKSGSLVVFDITDIEFSDPSLIVCDNAFEKAISKISFSKTDQQLMLVSASTIGILSILEYGVSGIGTYACESPICAAEWIESHFEDPHMLCIGCENQDFLILKTADEVSVTHKTHIPDPISFGNWITNSNMFVSISEGTIIVYRVDKTSFELSSFVVFDCLSELQGKATGVSFSSDMTYCSMTMDDGRVVVCRFEIDRFQLSVVYQTPLLCPSLVCASSSIEFSPTNQQLFIGGIGGCVGIIDTSRFCRESVIRASHWGVQRAYWKALHNIKVEHVPLFQYKTTPKMAHLASAVMTAKLHSAKTFKLSISTKTSSQNDDGGSRDDSGAGDGGGGVSEGQEDQNELNTVGITEKLEAFRDKFQNILRQNDFASDLERLDRTEFAVDVEQLEELKRCSESKSDVVRHQIEKKNLGNELIAKRIRSECIDGMEVRSQYFDNFSNSARVFNFPITKTSKRRLHLLEKVKFIRNMELKEQKWRADNPSMDVDDYHLFEPEKYIPEASTFLGTCSPVCFRDNGKDVIVKKVSDMEQYLYHPMQCVTNQRKRFQTFVVHEIAKEIKRAFNDMFMDFCTMKQREVEKVEEKAARIKEIEEELKYSSKKKVISLSSLNNATVSDPEADLRVSDQEIAAPRPLTEAEILQQGRSKVRVHDEDEDEISAPTRALTEMMNGTLEVRRDLSILEQELQREEWMDTIPLDEMTDEQKTFLAAFEKKVEIIQQEKDTRRKLLETELNKLCNQIEELFRKFDTKVNMLSRDRVLVLLRICEMESVTLHLVNDVIQDQDNVILLEKIRAMVTSEMQNCERVEAEIVRYRESIQKKKEEYQLAVAEEKIMEKKSRAELQTFADHSDYLIQLFKSSRKDPNAPQSSKKVKKAAAMKAKDLVGAVPRVSRGNKSDKAKLESMIPGLAKQSSNKSLSTQASATVVKEAEDLKPSQISAVDPYDLSLFGITTRPEDVSIVAWETLIREKKKLIAQQEEVKVMEKDLSSEEDYVAALCDQLEQSKREIETHEREIDTLERNRMLSFLSSEIIVNAIQGQIEIEEAPVVTDFRTSWLVRRNDVETLNQEICLLGDDKVDILSGIVKETYGMDKLEWKYKLLELDYTDAAVLTKEMQLLRVTKNLQSLIKVGGHDIQKAAELTALQKKMEYITASTDEQIDELRAQFQVMLKRKKKQEEENNRLMNTVMDLESAVKQREEIRKMTEREGGMEHRHHDEKMRQIIEMRRLNDLVRMQQEEFRTLNAHAEQLRRKTFACFEEPVERRVRRHPPRALTRNSLSRSVGLLPPISPSRSPSAHSASGRRSSHGGRRSKVKSSTPLALRSSNIHTSHSGRSAVSPEYDREMGTQSMKHTRPRSASSSSGRPSSTHDRSASSYAKF